MKSAAARYPRVIRFFLLIGISAALTSVLGLAGQGQPGTQARPAPAIKTPLPQSLLTLIANEISGQMAFNNLMRLAGAPWVRDVQELRETMSETIELERLVRSYGISTVEAIKYPPAAPAATFDYPLEGELWTLEPEKRLLARIGADAALISRGSKTADVSGELIYVPALTPDEAKKMRDAGPTECHARQAGPGLGPDRGHDHGPRRGRDCRRHHLQRPGPLPRPRPGHLLGRPLDQAKNIKLGLAVSWRQWSELLEDVELNRKVVLRASAKVEKFPDRFEMIHAWIPGTRAG